MARRRRWLSAKLDQLHADIGYVRRDSQLHTPLAILLNMLLALPLSLLLALGGLALQMDARGQNAALGTALVQMAQAWLVFYTAYRVMVPGGVAERHFQWPVGQVRELHRYLRRLGLVVLAVVAIVDGLRSGVEVVTNVLGQQAFYTQALPIIDRSLSELLNFTDTFLAGIQAAGSTPTALFQQVELTIESALGIRDPDLFQLAVNAERGVLEMALAANLELSKIQREALGDALELR